ncbi:MAG: hypothetical protein AAF098_02975 [Pseudomonadota bacterium]
MSAKLHRTITTWAAVYPIITCLIFILEPLISAWPIPIRTLLLSSIMVPVMVLWAAPAINHLVGPAAEAASEPKQQPGQQPIQPKPNLNHLP